MSEEAKKFVEAVRKIDAELADLIKIELERGVSLTAMQDFLRGTLAIERQRRKTP